MIGSFLLCIFILDTITDVEIAFAVLYVGVILLAVRFLSKRGVRVLATICIFLTILSFCLTSSGIWGAGIWNCLISLSAIGIAAYLALKIVDAEAAIHESHAQLARIARITSLGELAASIAHEVNQPLAAIATTANACRRWLDAHPPNVDKARQSADRIVHDANRASEVVARVRRWAEGQPALKEKLDLNKSIYEALSLAQQEIVGRNISLHLHLENQLPPVFVDPVQIQQVIANLLLNAIEAMLEGPSYNRQLEVTSRSESGKVLVAVADTGVGIPGDALDRPFDAFWTTKEKGIGIGLSISRSIIEAHGGRIWAMPNVNTGAVFQFTLPIEEETTR